VPSLPRPSSPQEQWRWPPWPPRRPWPWSPRATTAPRRLPPATPPSASYARSRATAGEDAGCPSQRHRRGGARSSSPHAPCPTPRAPRPAWTPTPARYAPHFLHGDCGVSFGAPGRLSLASDPLVAPWRRILPFPIGNWDACAKDCFFYSLTHCWSRCTNRRLGLSSCVRMCTLHGCRFFFFI
jgi:hypothetical protein